MSKKVLLLKRAGSGNPRRRRASAKDETTICSGCQNYFVRAQRIEWKSTGEPVHKYICWNRYLAALAVHYDLQPVELVTGLHVSSRTAYRIVKLGRELLERS